MAAAGGAAAARTALQVLKATPVPLRFWPRFKLKRRIGWENTKETVRLMINDYTTVFRELAEESRSRPVATVAKFCAAGVIVHVAMENPSEVQYRGALIEANDDLALLPRALRNPVSYDYVKELVHISGQGRLHFTNLGLFSIVTRGDYTPGVVSFEAQHWSVSSWARDIKDRIVDVGFYGRFPNLEKAMVDWDVNF